MIIIPIPSRFCNEKWNYKCNGKNWECECKEGIYQSPIDIESVEKKSTIIEKTIFVFNNYNSDNSIKILLENSSIKIKGNFGKLTTLDYVEYDMYEMVIHIGSEHRLYNIKYDMEVQIYYKAITPGYIRKSAALGILYKITPSATNLFFDKDINILDLPDKYESEKEISCDIDMNHLFMLNERDTFKEFSYYQYEGSITAPPCREDTTWYIVADPLPISYTTVETIKDAVKTLNEESLSDLLMATENIIDESFQENVRNIQPINGRNVYYYESCVKKNMAMCKGSSNGCSNSI